MDLFLAGPRTASTQRSTRPSRSPIEAAVANSPALSTMPLRLLGGCLSALAGFVACLPLFEIAFNTPANDHVPELLAL